MLSTLIPTKIGRAALRSSLVATAEIFWSDSARVQWYASARPANERCHPHLVLRESRYQQWMSGNADSRWVQDGSHRQDMRMSPRLTNATLMSDIETEWTSNASLTRLSSYRKCSKRRILGHSAQATSLLRIAGTTKCSRRALGSGFGSGMASAAEVKPKAGQFKAYCFSRY
jgi:hypothetical protein